MDLLNSIFEYFTNGASGYTKKLYFALALLIVALFADFIFGFSYHYYNQNKLDTISKIESLKSDYNENDELVKELNKMESETLYKDHFYTRIYKFYSGLFTVSDQVQDEPQINSFIDDRNKWFNLISGNIFWLLVLIILPFVPFSVNKGDRLQTSLGVVSGILILLVVVWITSSVLGLIPTLIYPWVNYLLNFLTQAFIVYLISKSNKRKKEDKLIQR